MGRLIPDDQWQTVLRQQPGHQDYYFGNIRLVNKAHQQKHYMLSPRYVNSANFLPGQTQRERQYPRQCVVPFSAINCEIGFVSMGGFTFAFFKTTRAISGGEELITHYGSGWSNRLQRYASECAGRKQDDMDVA